MINIKPVRSLVILFIVLIGFSCSNSGKNQELYISEIDLEHQNIIPKPFKIIATNSGFKLDKFTTISTSENAEGFVDIGEFLVEKFKIMTNFDLPMNDDSNSNKSTVICIRQSDNPEFVSLEAYQLTINSDSVILSSNTVQGAFRGIQTLLQLIPEESDTVQGENKIWVLPTGEITDFPQFEYRGAMLDVARHFFTVDEVKKYIELLAYYKFNALHLHLTDDQGWRIEIKSWPKLTQIGASSEVGGGPGGFYTQEDYMEIVNFAAKHHMLIVPEVDMPGHTNAALVAYPMLNGNGKTPKMYQGVNVGFSTFDTQNDRVYAFIDDVVREIAAITPGPYFHMGGDESHVTSHNDYIYFVNRVEKIVQKYGKTVIGWEEIANADVDSNSIAQLWARENYAKIAVGKGMKVIVSPAKKAYLDMQYDSLSTYGLHWAAYISVDTAYQWNPETYYDIPLENIFGIEAPLWSETISDSKELEYLAFPRVIGYAELGWSVKENRNWENYKVRLANQTPFLKRMQVNYYQSALIQWE